MILSSLESDESPYYTKQVRMSKILLADWIANFAMDDGCEKLRMKETTNELEISLM